MGIQQTGKTSVTRSTRWLFVISAAALYLTLTACKGVYHGPYYTGYSARHHYRDHCANYNAHTHPVFTPAPAPKPRFSPPLYRQNPTPWPQALPPVYTHDKNPY